ncbi:uncharacterized protein LOC119615859 [Lucilia sericata]|uniref:uncharacterized protein LOC119615859 n=1 Tax=Lucilia sericata TaxID=13632 RepID=UPI0018A86635|nr:uncharacterized protein LOC119615859 [Lucilia sericata]
MWLQLKVNCLMKFLLLLLVYLPSIQSNCVIEYPRDEKTIPKYEKSFGKYKLRVPYNGNPIKLSEGETIKGFCDTYFSPINYKITEKSTSYDYHYGYRDVVIDKSIFNQSTIVLECHNHKLVYNDIELSEQTFSCIPHEWTIYSTKQPYSWCQNNQNSSTFLLGTQQSTGNYILAAICYNLEQMSLQTVVYNVTNNVRGNHMKQPMNLQTTNTYPKENVDENLQNFKTATLSDLSEELLQEKLTELTEIDEWLNLANYEISSIVQDETLKEYFKEYDNILKTVWWRNLRLGNWKRFQKTLANYAKYNKFEIYTGTSGVAQYPSEDRWYKEKPLEMTIGFKNETIPAYIWSYLKSYDNVNKEFIIFAYNSPYTEYFTTEKVIFCPDICADIPWLDEIYPSFRYAFAGTMFCCSTDYIRQTNNLPGFPMEILMAAQIETTISSVETTTLQVETTTSQVETTTLELSTDIY